MGDVYYETYADAVKDAQNNAIITILVAPDAGETIDVGDKTIQFKAGQGVTLQANMFKGTVTSSADGSFTVAPENTEGDGSHNNPGGGTSSGGSGSSGSSNYSLNVSSSSHGTVDVSHTNACLLYTSVQHRVQPPVQVVRWDRQLWRWPSCALIR